MRGASGEAVELPDGDDIEAALVGVSHQAIKFRTRFHRSKDSSIDVFSNDSPAAALAELAELPELHLCR